MVFVPGGKCVDLRLWKVEREQHAVEPAKLTGSGAPVVYSFVALSRRRERRIIQMSGLADLGEIAGLLYSDVR